MSVFAKQLAAGRGSGAPVGRTSGIPAGGRGSAPASKSSATGPASKAISAGPLKASAKAASASRTQTPKANPSAKDTEVEGGVLNCANRGLFHKMLLAHGIAEDDDIRGECDEENDEPNPLQMSIRNVSVASQIVKHVPTISSPAIGGHARPVSRGGLPVAPQRPGSSHGASTGGYGPSQIISGAQQMRGRFTAPGVVVPVVATGPPMPVASIYVSAPRPGSRGAGGGGVPPPAGQEVRKIQPTPSSSTAARATSSYSSLHSRTAVTKPPTPKMQAPAAKPLCGPSAFAMLRQLEETKVPEQANESWHDNDLHVPDYADEDDGHFVMPSSDCESDADDFQVMLARQKLQPKDHYTSPSITASSQKAALPEEESAADYVERLKRSLASSPVPEARARSSDARGTEIRPVSEVTEPEADSKRSSMRSRSTDPRTAVAAARLSSPPDSDDEDDDEDDAPQGMQWKADVKDLVRNFALEERARLAKCPQPSTSSTTSKQRQTDATMAQVAPKKPPRVPASIIELSKKAADEVATASKKPRLPVEYTPATVDEYKHRFGAGGYSELGHLGPDLDDDQLMLKKAVQEKVKQFSKELNRINRQRTQVSSSAPKKPDPKPEPKPTSRAKALEFAKHVPKPKVQAPKAVHGPSQNASVSAADEEDNAEWEEIRRRERQHYDDVLRVEQIREYLKSLPD